MKIYATIEYLLKPDRILPISGFVTGLAALAEGSWMMVIVGLINLVAGMMMGLHKTHTI